MARPRRAQKRKPYVNRVRSRGGCTSERSRPAVAGHGAERAGTAHPLLVELQEAADQLVRELRRAHEASPATHGAERIALGRCAGSLVGVLTAAERAGLLCATTLMQTAEARLLELSTAAAHARPASLRTE